MVAYVSYWHAVPDALDFFGSCGWSGTTARTTPGGTCPATAAVPCAARARSTPAA